VDTLCSDIGSVSQTYNFIRELFASVRNRASEWFFSGCLTSPYIRTDPSSLTLHIVSPSPLIPLLTSSSLSSSLVHLITHPPKLISHLATSYLTLPPPASPPAKFWGIFIPMSERGCESDRLVFGPGGDSGGLEELVVEVVLRGGEDSLSRRKRVERTLEGWSRHDPCGLTELESLRHIWNRKPVDEVCFLERFSPIFIFISTSRLRQIPQRAYLLIWALLLRSGNRGLKSHSHTLMKVITSILNSLTYSNEPFL
jgi:elongator complex protein 5